MSRQLEARTAAVGGVGVAAKPRAAEDVVVPHVVAQAREGGGTLLRRGNSPT